MKKLLAIAAVTVLFAIAVGFRESPQPTKPETAQVQIVKPDFVSINQLIPRGTFEIEVQVKAYAPAAAIAEAQDMGFTRFLEKLSRRWQRPESNGFGIKPLPQLQHAKAKNLINRVPETVLLC